MTPSDASRRPSIHAQATSALRWSRHDWAVLVLLALLTALFFWRILTPNLADRASFPPGDFSYQFWAFSTFEARELSAGRLPLWNPYTYAGAPFWADIQSAVLYPPSLLTLLLSGLWGFSLFALEVEAVVHFWLAGTFTYLFIRRLTHQRGAALFAAITFTFSGYLTGYPSQQLAVLETDVWLPLLLYFADRALIDRSGGLPHFQPNLPNTLAAGLVWGLALLAGHPQSAMFVFYMFLLYVMFLIWSHRQQRRIQPAHQTNIRQRRSTGHSLLPTPYSLILIPLPVLLIGLGLSATAWLPGLEYMRLSVRAAGFYDKMSGGFPLYDAVQILLPGSVSFYSPLYIGVLPLLLALWAALTGRTGRLHRRETTFWGALALGALLLAFGGETFLYSLLYLLAPGFSIFRDQERAAFIVSFTLAVLAGYGFKYQITNQHPDPGGNQSGNLQSPASKGHDVSNLQTIIGWLLIGALGLVVLFFYALNNAGWQNNSPFNLLLSRSVWLVILLALTWGTMQAARNWPTKTGTRILLPPPQTYLAICYLLIATLDLFTINWKTNIHPSLPEAQTAVPGVIQAIRADAPPDEIFRVYNEYRIYENYGVPYSLEDTWGASPLRLARYDQLHRSLRMERVWELLNVKYVITWREELYAPSEIIYQETVGDEVTYVHRLNRVAPRAWFVHQVQEVDEDATLARLDAFDLDPAQVALVPRGTWLTLEAPSTGESSSDDGNRQVEIIRRTPGSLTLNVSTPVDRLLVLSEIYYPGWRAAVDGQTTTIIRVNYILRGVPVPTGQHRVQVFYQPVTFIAGAAISGITLLAVAAIGFWIWRHRKSPNEI